MQQADLVADDIARHLGLRGVAPSVPKPPVLRAALMDGEGTMYLRAEHVDGTIRTEVSSDPLWWPPTKIAGGRLPSWLAAFAAGASDGVPERLRSGGA